MEENKRRRRISTPLLLFLILMGITLALCLTVLGIWLHGRSVLRSKTAEPPAISTDSSVLDQHTIYHDGKYYRYKDGLVNLLFIGVDSDEKPSSPLPYGNDNQADVVLLAVLDTNSDEMTLISVSRDAMCTLDILDSAGEHVGTATAQLALAYAYGDGAERSCELTSAAVSRLFYDLPIPVYGSIYMQGIRQLVDSVGGVTVTPDTSIPGFAAGQPVTLTGQLTESYIRYRADSTEGNNQRMQRQKQVVLALVHKMLAQVKEDPASILALYNNVRRNTTTNINTAMMVYLAQQASGMHFSDDIVNVPGMSVMGEQRHAEYQVDSDALLELILSIFYEPVEG